ncbi:MAG: peptidylprolyl isomerase [Phycisphaeraceae bacterium]|nr:peptidylprolyl isomerase [Phycisphaeraceae bacterium]
MPRRLIRSITAAAARRRRERGLAAPSHFEQLEPRILFSTTGPAFIQDIVADNRGLITLDVCGDLDASTVNETSVQVFTAGADNLFGTFDDVIEASGASYNINTGRITILTVLDPDTRYGVRVDSSIVRGTNGFLLDGEFNGAGMPTGDGLSGGDLLFYTKTATTKVARYTTNLGDIDIALFTQETPITVANFLNYANSGRYDNTIIHRSVTDFVIQGGGFKNQLGFRSIDRDAAIQNEPGISNTRGTVAFAKVGNNPNSATSEWFFNLGDNSENLDNQNGGFTVFGEITNQAGLDVMDAIAALDTVNASGINSAFTDIPVTDIDLISGNPAALNPTATVAIHRVAVIQDLSATPPEQIQADSYTYGSNRDVFVTVYDLGGLGRDEIDNVVSVKFSGNTVSSIKVSGDLPAGAIGLVIGDASRVGSIRDSGADSSIAFIFSNAPVSSINLKGDITGFNINGLNLGGVLLSDDVDNDGVFDDQTSVLINSGEIKSFQSTGAISGDILLPGGVSRLNLRGLVSDSQIRLGAAEDPLATIKAQISDAHNTMLVSEAAFQTLTVDRWTVDTGAPNTPIDAPAIRSLKLTGAFDADLTLTGVADSEDPTLGKMNATNGLFGATFDITGDLDSFSVRGDTGFIDVNVVGSINKIKLDDLLNSSITSTRAGTLSSVKIGAVTETDVRFVQDVRKLTAGSWDGGSLAATAIQTLKVTDRDGVFNPDFHLDVGFIAGVRSKSITIDSAITGGMWNVAGDVDRIRIQDASDAEIVVNGSVVSFSGGDLTRFNLGIRDEINTVTTGTWFRGNAAINIFNRMTVNGDFRADLTATHANRFLIAGDLYIADVFFTQQPDIFGTYSIRELTVGGEMRDVEFRAAFRVGDISAKAMHNSIIGVSNSIPNNDFPVRTDVDGFASIESVTISGPRNGAPNFTDSYIIAAGIGDVVLGEIESFNSNHEFGVGAFQLDSITYFADGEEVNLHGNQLNVSPEPFGDFEIRINFERFDDTTG